MTTKYLLAIPILVTAGAWSIAGFEQSNPSWSQLQYPAADRVEAADVLHGVTVADPYRWLEDLESHKTRSWIKAQDDLTREQLDGPTFADLRKRIERLANLRRYTAPVRRGNRWFFFETDSNGTSGRVIMMRDGATANAQALVDLRQQSGETLTRVLAPSPDGRLLAYGITVEGSRWLRLKFINPSTSSVSSETLDDLHSSMSPIAWTPDSRSFYYIRFDPPAGPRLTAPVTGGAVMRHVLGTPQVRDERVFQLDDAAHRVYAPAVTDDGRWLVVTSSIGASTNQQVWAGELREGRTAMAELFPGISGQFTFLGSHGDHFWFQTSVDAPRQRVVRVDARRPGRGLWHEVVTQPDEVETISYVNMIAERLIVFSTRDAAPRVRIHSLSGALERELPLPPLETVWGPSGGSVGFSGRPSDREAYYVMTGVADPGSVYALDPTSGRTTLFLRPSFGFDPDDFVGRQVFYTAEDGTRIPMFIAHHKSIGPNEARATFMYGYGAFGWAAFPWFQPQILAWMEAGGVYAIPCLRGGGEYGARWHEAGIREKKQTSVGDYIAAAEWLLANGVAAPGALVANGGSVSGVVAAAAMVQRPALFGAAVIDIPALDMVRYDRHTGAATWIPEFGSTKSLVELKALRALSPYHNLDAKVCYPPTLVLAGEKDDVAVPSHAYKFIAALQASQPCTNPALLQVAWGAGHTFGNSNESSADNWARQLAFLSRAIHFDSGRPQATEANTPPSLPSTSQPPVQPTTAAPTLSGAQARLQTSDVAGAITILEALAKQSPRDPDVWQLLGSAYRQSKNLSRALEAYQKVLEVRAESPQTFYGLGVVYALQRDVDRAFEWLEKARASRQIDMSQMEVDTDLASLRSSPRMARLRPTDRDFADPFVEPTRILREWRGEAANDQFGWIARNIGDVDGDRIADVVTSAPTKAIGGAGAGRIYVYSTATGALKWTADGQPGDRLGIGVEGAGDTNHDGVPDVIAAAPGGGYAKVYSGDDGRVLLTFRAEDRADAFGRHVASVGDVDRDGFADVIIGAPGNDAGGNGAGRAYVYSGKDGRTLMTLTGEGAGDAFGSAVAGHADASSVLLLVGAPGAGPSKRGRTYVYDALTDVYHGAKPAFVIDADETGAALGAMFLSVPGDVDRDGTPDVYASDFSNSARGPSTGRVVVHSGKTGHRLLTLTGETSGEGFGTSPSVAGDVNGDGHADLIVGAWQYAGAATSGGRAYLYSGKDGILIKTITCRIPGDTFGFDANEIGDVNGDGMVDLLVTSAWSGVRGFHSGRMFVISSGVQRAASAR